VRYYAASFLLMMAFLAGCKSGSIQVPLTDAPDSPVVSRPKMDCDVMAEKTRTLRLSLDASVLGAARVGPAVQFGKSVTHRWNDNVNTVNAMYKTLCNDWNTGIHSVASYRRKKDEVDDLYAVLAKDGGGFREAVGEYWNERATMALSELDRELQKKHERELKELQGGIEDEFEKVDSKFQSKLSKIKQQGK
jgi:hypothetical protein